MENNEAKKKEASFLYDKHVRCTVCQEQFEVKIVRNARLRRLQSDFDLRPRFQDIDTAKYEIYSCPHCGYSALSRYFEEPLTKGQIGLIKENICTKFKPSATPKAEVYDYQTAAAYGMQALRCCTAKHAKASEAAYTCLKLAWLYRAWKESVQEEEIKAKAAQQEEMFYKKAYEGLKMAVSTEEFPICGMDAHTMDFLLASIASYFKDYGYASRSISNILSSKTADRRIKDRALDLKTVIVKEMKKETEEAEEKTEES